MSVWESVEISMSNPESAFPDCLVGRPFSHELFFLGGRSEVSGNPCRNVAVSISGHKSGQCVHFRTLCYFVICCIINELTFWHGFCICKVRLNF